MPLGVERRSIHGQTQWRTARFVLREESDADLMGRRETELVHFRCPMFGLPALQGRISSKNLAAPA